MSKQGKADQAAITAIASALTRRGLETGQQQEAAWLYGQHADLAYVALCVIAGECTETQLDAKLESVLLP